MNVASSLTQALADGCPLQQGEGLFPAHDMESFMLAVVLF